MRNKILLTIAFLLVSSQAWGATVYGSAAGGNWSSDAGTWVTSDGGSTTANHPVAGDTVYLTVNSGNVTVDATSACAVLDCTGYTNTLTQSANLTTTGNVTLVASKFATSGTPTWTFSGGTFIPAGNTLYNVTTNTSTVTLSTSDLTVSHNLTSSAAITGRTITMTGGTWSGGSTVSSNLTFAGDCTVSGTVSYSTGTITWSSGTIDTAPSGTKSTLNIGASTTLNTPRANMTWGNITMSASSTLTLSSNTECVGNFTSTSGTTTLATSDMFVGGNIGGAGTLGGGTARTITMNGTGTWSGAGYIDCNLTFDTAGTITLDNSNRNFGSTSGCTLTYTSGTMTVGTSVLVLRNSGTLDTSGMTWYTVGDAAAGSSMTTTLTSDLNVSNKLQVSTSITWTISGAGNIYVEKDLSQIGTGIITGRTIYMTGTGTWSHTGSGAIKSNLVFDTAGTITVSGNVYHNTGTLTYTSGTITTTSSTLNIAAASTLDTNGMTWNNIVKTGSNTLTLSSALQCASYNGDANSVLACGTNNVTMTGNLTIAKGTTGRTGNNTFIFDGTSVLDGNTNFYNMTVNAGKTVTFDDADTFTVTGTFNADGTAGAITMNTDNPGTTVDFDVTTLGTVIKVNATDIDSAGGVEIVDTDGNITNTVNWTNPSSGAVPICSAIFGAEF